MESVTVKKVDSLEDFDTVTITEAVLQVLEPAYRVYENPEAIIDDVTLLLYDCKREAINQHAVCAEFLLRIRSFFMTCTLKPDSEKGRAFMMDFCHFPIDEILSTCDDCIAYLSDTSNTTKEFESIYFNAEMLFRALKRTCTYALRLHESK